jgi:hypothetical protein
MNVRMIASERIAAVLACSAWTRLRAVAQETLAQPQGEALLADAKRPVKHERSRQCVATDGVVEASAKDGMAVNGKQGHEEKLAWSDA